MKIVYCILGTYNSGGMERVLANKANFLAKQGHKVVVVTTDQQGRKPYFELDSRISQVDLDINYTDIINKGILDKAWAYFFKRRAHKQRLMDWLNYLKADIVISMFDHDASFLHTIKDGSKKVLEVHFSRYKKLQYDCRGLMGWINRIRSANDMIIARRYDRFIVLTEEDRSHWGNLPNMVVIPNANSFVPEGTAELQAKQVVAVGRYGHQKAYDQLIQAWKYVSEIHPDWSLKIFGQGSKLIFQNLVEKLGLQCCVHLRDAVKNIEAEYFNSSVMVMTSRYEGLPMALLEAQACGLPLVSYSCKCGPRDIIHDGRNGFLVNEGDITTLADRLIKLLGNSKLRQNMGSESRRLSANFSEDVIMEQWLNLFEKLIKERP